ncbi:uncharacterized protein LOC100574715 isoform X2 [Acyrthosiphon pisum]|nr:uncharacterized protein LOC100574715 isoform X2 [Acyrthosiphon pisum]XP_029348645.1 uncharacterized protein LOC100574715 isoform X2 [Acyrthosiphon pisum]|eukprot:XP_016662978.1 PREDICTED: uncharacterized protein LOC100574715 isoform X2 [Acyrthosiphon pisum]
MAIRFTQICVSSDQNTNEWWNNMKELFQSKCIIYNFKYPLDSATYFDDLTRKQKVEALYIFCNFILDVKNIQNKLSNNTKIRHMLNITPLGYDLNKSVYWYFGSNKLYREDYENSTNLPVEYYTNGKIQYAPYPSGVFGPGKWNTICNDIDDWNSLADIIKYSKNKNIRYLHRAISNIIINLPKVIKNKSHYAYIKPLKSVCQRTLRSMDVMNAECKNVMTNSSVIQHKQYSQNVKKNQTKHTYDSTISQGNETSNPNVHDHNHNITYSTNVLNNNIQIGTLINNPALKLELGTCYKKVLDKCAKKNIVFDKVPCIKLERCDRENTHNLNNFKRKLRSSTNGTKTQPFKD